MIFVRTGDVDIVVREHAPANPITGAPAPSPVLRAIRLAKALESAGYPVEIHGTQQADFDNELTVR